MEKITKNRGMLLESIINHTNLFYLEQQKALVHKKNLDIKFKSVMFKENKLITNGAKIISKSTVDYYGIYNGNYFAFEAKSTEECNFSLKNVKKHQIEYLDLVLLFKGKAFWILYFKMQNKFIFIDHLSFKKISQNKKSLKFNEVLSYGKELILEFPGILDYISCLE
ncbi:Holliday junction resolvase RecU [[Mycoplasma] anseris]|uniref:Holliday junction resolvase RecU n=1 Tax=[Mycoplasma] anseris TaxID=92400 RepID=A0A2Z4NC95_9BACT|nr:Holliday junction resolvase RecU [[Mycoplasma] anseris]AWX69168.1 Holliday junction resolvase RecU [[Mycoplasma] anseris]